MMPANNEGIREQPYESLLLLLPPPPPPPPPLLVLCVLLVETEGRREEGTGGGTHPTYQNVRIPLSHAWLEYRHACL